MTRWLACLLPELPLSSRLVIDAGYAWTGSDEALTELAGWGAIELAWLEDPLPPEDVVAALHSVRIRRSPSRSATT